MKKYFAGWIGILAMLAVFMIGSTVQTARADDQDSQLTQKVRAALANYYNDNYIISEPLPGKIRIQGQVPTLYDRYLVFEIVSKVPGVKEIEDNLAITTSTLPDSVIATNVEEELNLVSSILEPERIHVRVDNGVVFLTGEVSFYREKIMAKTAASWQEGVMGIVNEIKVLPPQKAVSDANLRMVLQDILDSRFSLDKNVSFTVDNGTVVLNGPVVSLWDKQQMQQEFSRVIGVKKVVNNLVVEPAE